MQQFTRVPQGQHKIINNKACALIPKETHHTSTHLPLLAEEAHVVCLMMIH